ncbi:MAG TPA: LytTR family DNA-binding domain-containing protein [Segetibacter sp.]|jgi:two-component system LytT family response regulator
MEQQLKAIIVDDEPAARRFIQHLCKERGNIEVIAEAANGTSAIELINTLKPDVVFLDIQMPDITGLDVIRKISFQPNIIFTTAYEHFALKAFEAFAVDYLLKPIKKERFSAAVEKLKTFGKQKEPVNYQEIQKLISDLRPKPQPKALPVKIGEKIILLNYQDIAYMEANDKYVHIYVSSGNKYLVDLTLSALEGKLPADFIRIQKSYIVNKAFIKEVHKHFNSRFIFILNDKSNTRITSGLTFYNFVKDDLGF